MGLIFKMENILYLKSKKIGEINMYKKILSFIINENNQLLLLRNNPEDPIHGGDIWYTVTGGFDDNETDGKEVVIREIKEETNLDVKEAIYLNWIFSYNFNDVDCIEYAYISFVENGDIILNEESIDYKWCSLDEFINETTWFGDVSMLRNVLTYAMSKKIYFDTEKTEYN